MSTENAGGAGMYAKAVGKLRKNVWLLVPLVVVLGAGIAAFVIVNKSSAAEPQQCVGAQASEFACWRGRYTTMIDQKDPEAAFVDFKANYDSNPYVKSNCHQIGHALGRAAAAKYKTLAETYKHGDQFCWSGYYHGAVETIAQDIGKDRIVAQLGNVCGDFMKQQAYSFDHYNCVHGMGHGLMAVEGNELFKSLDICNDGYTDSWEQQSCYGGAFMENVMSEINPGQKSKYIKADDPLYPCTAVKVDYKQQCYLMQTSHALIVVNNDYAKVFELCSGIEAPFNITCYQSLGRDVSGQSGSNEQITLERCELGPSYEAKENCYIGAVKDYISYFHSDQQGLAMCAKISDASLQKTCVDTANEYYKTF